MQKLILAFVLFAFIACDDKPSGKILSASSGALNNLTVEGSVYKYYNYYISTIELLYNYYVL